MDTYDFLADPRTLTLAERHAARDEYDLDQAVWLNKLHMLVEQPKPANDFPAFLLATQPFSDLARKLKNAEERKQLPTDVQDELDWFIRAFAEYLRAEEGDVFSETQNIAS